MLFQTALTRIILLAAAAVPALAAPSLAGHPEQRHVARNGTSLLRRSLNSHRSSDSTVLSTNWAGGVLSSSTPVCMTYELLL